MQCHVVIDILELQSVLDHFISRDLPLSLKVHLMCPLVENRLRSQLHQLNIHIFHLICGLRKLCLYLPNKVPEKLSLGIGACLY